MSNSKMNKYNEENNDSHGLGNKERRSRSRSPIKRKIEPNSSSSKNDDATSSSVTPRNISLGAKNRLKTMSIQMKLTSNKSPCSNKPKMSVANAFNQDSDDEPDEMPAEAKMRMRNIGRNTPTSSGPNSFGKTKHGFSDAKKVFEKNLKEAMDAARAED